MAEDITKEHFNTIAESYKDEIPRHIRDHLINKWWRLVSCYFSANSAVLDIGCGDGTNVAFLNGKGINTIGVDLSDRLIKKGRERYPHLRDRLFEGDALNLQFPDNTFDAATLTGVLHHIHSIIDQRRAIQEAIRVVKENGIIIIRESNLTNPLFRIYWNYGFPLTARIDRFGGENWISAKQIANVCGEAVDNIFYFTFIPNFTPKILVPLAGRIERMLAKSPVRKLSAHYIIVLRKQI